ncbi:MAG TPA: hypothetical protein VM510_16725 [Caulifigura sp.]|jgi:hypothetical protein|nr:hypothetical protein [Caulifigura sp.]
MPRRFVIAVLLATSTAGGCASVSDGTISLVAEKPALNGWPWKKPAAPSVRTHDEPNRTQSSRSTSKTTPAQATQRFLETLPPELRSRIDEELAGASLEERTRLLSYLATVETKRIPALLDARRQQHAPAAKPEPKEVVTAAALGQPTFEIDSDEPSSGQVIPASAEAPVEATPLAPVPRPRRNPLIELQGLEFEDDESKPDNEVLPASNELLERQTEPAISEQRGPVLSGSLETADPPVIVPAPSSNPLTRLKEWTIRKPEPAVPSSEPVQTAMAPSDPSALSIQGLSRRLRGTPAKSETPVHEASPAPRGESPHVQEGVQKLIALMEAETARLKPGTSFAEREEYVRKHAELRMLYLMSRQPTAALQAIPETDVETQEFWTSMMWSMSNYFDNESMADPSERAAATLDRLRAAEQFLQTSARLELGSLAFCDKIDGFGAYHPFESDVFRPGQSVLLYAEVRNFKTDVTPAGRYRTSLRSTIEIVKAGDDGEMIERRHFDSTEDQSRSPRRDYFHSYKLDLPLHITPGNYQLRLTLEDELSGKIGTSTIDFLVR